MAHILIAQQSHVTAAYLTNKLRRAGHTIRTVDNCLELWRISAQEGFDIMLVDTRMPGIDGFVLTQRARRDTPDLQVIFIKGFSGAVLDALATPAYAPAPITGHPFHLRSIVSYVRYLLGGDAPETPRHENWNNVIYPNFGYSHDTLQHSF